MHMKGGCAVAGLLALALAPARLAAATIFQVSPVLVEATAGSAAEVLTVTNPSDQPITLQIRVFRWTQEEGRDVLTPSTDVIASPPAMTVKTGGQHLVRIVRTGTVPPRVEEAYRLLIDEIPDPDRTGAGQVTLLLRQSIPVFFGSRARRGADLRWQVVRGPAGWALAVANPGDRRQRISDLEVRDAKGTLLQRRPGLVGYALSGAGAFWPLALPVGYEGPVLIKAASDAGPVHVDLAAQRAP